MHFVIFKADDGTLSALSPAPGWEAQIVGRKDVPPLEDGTPRPFLVVEADRWPEEVPAGRSFDTPDGYGIGTEAWQAEQESEDANG